MLLKRAKFDFVKLRIKEMKSKDFRRIIDEKMANIELERHFDKKRAKYSYK